MQKTTVLACATGFLAVAGCGDRDSVMGGNAEAGPAETGAWEETGDETGEDPDPFCGDGLFDEETCADGTIQAGEVCFSHGDTVVTGPRVSSLFPGDFDADGVVDLFTRSGVLWGQGDGSFELGANPTTADVFGVAAGDLNGDGKDDAAASYSYYAFDSQDLAEVHILLGESFEQTVIDTHPWYPKSIEIADIDSDGRDDLIVVGDGGDVDGCIVEVYDGTTQIEIASVSLSGYRCSVGAHDLDGDGDNDLLLTGVYDTEFLVVLNENGNFGDEIRHAEPLSFRGYDVDDVNCDGFPDIAVAGVDRPVTVLRGDGTGSFPQVENLHGWTSTRDTEIADLNADGTPDFVVSNDKGVDLLIGDGADGVRPVIHLQTNTTWTDVDVEDVNGDGALDLVGSGEEGVEVVLARP